MPPVSLSEYFLALSLCSEIDLAVAFLAPGVGAEAVVNGSGHVMQQPLELDHEHAKIEHVQPVRRSEPTMRKSPSRQ